MYGTAEVVMVISRTAGDPDISWSWNLSGEPLTHGESFVPPKRTVHEHP